MGTPHGALALSANETSDWVQAHAALSRLSRERAALDAEEGRWLLCAWRSGAHLHLGYGSFAQYVESLFGYRPRTTQEKLRVAEALETPPRLANALESGALSWCAARELTRVARPDTESSWLDTARGKTLRQLEALVASKAPGDTPDAKAIERPRPRVLRFEVEADTFATFREAVQHLQRSAGGRLDDDALLLALARHVLGDPRDDGRSSYQISLHVCAVCGGGAQLAAGERMPVDAAVVDMAECDAQHLGELLPLADAPVTATLRAANENAIPLADVEARAGAVDESREGSADASGDKRTTTHQRSGYVHVGAPSPGKKSVVSEKVSGAAEKNLQERAAGAHTHPRPRAKQSVPPALRRAVLARDQRRCRAPGCTHATFVDVHHVQPRAEGGRNEVENLLTLCGAHHRAIHRGELLIEPNHDGGFTFRHADGAAYGKPVDPRFIDAHAKVFSALRHLGFREGEVKAVLSELRGDAELGGATVERLLREALCRIRPKLR